MLSRFPLQLIYLTVTVSRIYGQYSYSAYESCEDCPVVGRINGGINTSSYNPRLRFSCSANYPVDWVYHYDEDDQVEIQVRTLEYKRYVQSFTNRSTYSYHINADVGYPHRLQLFPNFTCFSTQDPTKLTRLVVTGTTQYFQITAVTTPNDYFKSRLRQESCRAYTYFSLAAGVPYRDSIGPCYDCLLYPNATSGDWDYHLVPRKHSCNKPALCESLWHYEQQKNCITTFEGDFDSGCLGTQNDEIFCSTVDKKKCFVSNDLKPFVISCQKPDESSIIQAAFGFYGIRSMEKYFWDNAARPRPYLSWDHANQSDMIDLSRINADLETFIGQEVEFQCRVSSFYCSWPLWISIVYEKEEPHYKEMTIDIYPKPETLHNRTTIESSERLGDFYQTLFKFRVERPGQYQVRCHGPIFNSSEWLTASEPLHVLNVESLEVMSVVQDNPSPFKTGEHNRSIHCKYKGHPISSVRWEVDGNPVPEELYTETIYKSENKSVLLIPEVLKLMAKPHKCRLESFFDIQEMEFLVKVQETIPSTSITWIIVVTVALLGILIITLLVTLRFWKISRFQQSLLRDLTESEINEFKLGNPNYSLALETGSGDVPNAMVQMQPYDDKLEISMNKIQIDYASILGVGAFGMVVKGSLLNEDGDCNKENEYQNTTSKLRQEVAIKMVKPDVEVEHFKALLSEIKIMGYLGNHENIVHLHGASTENIRDRKVYIIVELCTMGSLESYLKNGENRQNFINMVEYGRLQKKSADGPEAATFSTLNLLKWTADIARGLQHVHEHNIIHGDLAVRNVLLNENLTAKISDFGLSRQLVNSSNYVKKSQVPLPWRHMSPEALQDKNFSKSSDMWAFAVTLWEIFELGHVPYAGETWGHGFLQGIVSGERLVKPKFATNELYEFMLQCWELEPQDRPKVDALTVLINSVENMTNL